MEFNQLKKNLKKDFTGMPVIKQFQSVYNIPDGFKGNITKQRSLSHNSQAIINFKL